MRRVITTIDIQRPARDVFTFVADQTNAPRWQHGLAEVRRTTDGPLGVGTRHVFVRRFAGRKISSGNRFVAYEPDRLVEFEFPGGWLHGRASYLVEPLGAARCRLTSEIAFQVDGPLRRLEALFARAMARDTRRDERELQRLLEGEALTQGSQP